MIFLFAFAIVAAGAAAYHWRGKHIAQAALAESETLATRLNTERLALKGDLESLRGRLEAARLEVTGTVKSELGKL